MVLAANGGFGANPFLSATDDRPAAATFRGTIWGDNIKGNEVPFSARVVTARLAKMGWGEIFKIEFTDLKARGQKKIPPIAPEYFVVTDNRIVLLNEEDQAAAVKRLAAMDKPPEFAQGDIYGITHGNFTYEDRPWETKIELKGDRCIYFASHNSGHFKTVIWKRGPGLVEYAMGSGARAEGFRLKRIDGKKR